MNSISSPIVANTLNGLCLKVFEKILTEGEVIESRNGLSYELQDIDLYLTSPRHRHLYLQGRTSNIFATMAETLWVLSGDNKLDPLMKFFLPRCVNYSDDGGLTWSGAYGPRIYYKDQIRNVVEQFLSDGINTRRACMSIWRPDMDTQEARGKIKSLDIPCSSFLHFWVRDNNLNCKLTMRSNDGIFGTSAINVFEFTFIQELICELLRLEGLNVNLGYYHHSVISLHLYGNTCKQAENSLNSHNYDVVRPRETFKLSLFDMNFKHISSKFSVKTIFSYFCNLLSKRIFGDLSFDSFIKELDTVFLRRDNILWWYVFLPSVFISAKIGGVFSVREILEIKYKSIYEQMPEDLKLAVQKSYLWDRKFNDKTV